jgi:hypothetical protein
MANTYLTENNIDDLGRMVVALLSELWIMRDRMAILEQVLVKSGALQADAVDAFTWTPEQTAEIDKLRDKLVSSVLGAPLAAEERDIDKILVRAGFPPRGGA